MRNAKCQHCTQYSVLRTQYTDGMPRFVVLQHEMPPGHPRTTHYDLMLEHDGVLRTWAMENVPSAGETIVAERLADHRLAYLEYEGEVSGNRGRVSRVAEGDYRIIEETEGAIVVQIQGAKRNGTLRLVRDMTETHRWRVSFSPG